VRTGDKPPLGPRDAPCAALPERRAFSPPRSDNVSHIVKRMNSAPISTIEPGSRSLAVRPIKVGQPTIVRSGASTSAAPAGPLLCGNNSTVARSVSLTRAAVRSAAAPLRLTSSMAVPAGTGFASYGCSAMSVVPPLSPDQGAGGAKGEPCCHRSEQMLAECRTAVAVHSDGA
jgi:hypothetical protein